MKSKKFNELKVLLLKREKSNWLEIRNLNESIRKENKRTNLCE